MTKAWTDKKEFQDLSYELATAEDREFERRVLPLIHIIWPDAVVPPAMRWLDRSGIDILVWSDSDLFPLVIQCKGFKVPEEKIGKSQIDQCKDSIASFRDSGLKAETYLLIHNRTGKNAILRSTVEAEIQKLVESGQVCRAELWDRQELLSKVFNKMLELVRSSVESNRLGAQDYGEHTLYEPLEHVPFELSDLVADPNHLVSQSKPKFCLSDPAIEVLSSDRSNLILMIGEAGYGKTTVALRALACTNHLIFYVPAATIPKNVNSTMALLRHCIKPERLFDDVLNKDRQTLERLTGPIMKYLLKDEATPVILILDGLDESVYFSRRGGLQSLFNQLRDIRVPVVMTARKEFWTQRQIDFSNLFGEAGSRVKGVHRRIRLIELLPWEKEQIGLLARRYTDTLKDAEQREHLNRLIQIIESNEYEDYYGDIPRRPLFLKFILETVAQRGVHRTGRARLYYEWAKTKIIRDIRQPMRWGTVKRAPIISEGESADMTLRLAFHAMMLAAFRMTLRRGNTIELLPYCFMDEILLSDERLKQIIDPTGLFLNSLLVPMSAHLSHGPLQVRFGHRAYQEFLLALYLREHPGELENVILPDEVAVHIKELDNESLTVSEIS